MRVHLSVRRCKDGMRLRVCQGEYVPCMLRSRAAASPPAETPFRMLPNTLGHRLRLPCREDDVPALHAPKARPERRSALPATVRAAFRAVRVQGRCRAAGIPPHRTRRSRRAVCRTPCVRSAPPRPPGPRLRSPTSHNPAKSPPCLQQPSGEMIGDESHDPCQKRVIDDARSGPLPSGLVADRRHGRQAGEINQHEDQERDG